MLCTDLPVQLSLFPALRKTGRALKFLILGIEEWEELGHRPQESSYFLLLLSYMKVVCLLL